MSLSEEELIRRARSGDRDAFCKLAKLYERRLFALALYYCRNAHDAEDLSQEVWLKAYRAIGGFRGESGFYTWLRRIAINTFLNERRGARIVAAEDSAAPKGEVPFDDAYDLADRHAASVEEVFERRQLVSRITQALDDLTAQQRLIFLLKHREQMSCEEISETCGVSTGTVKKSLFRAINRIRERLGVPGKAKEQTSAGINGRV